LSGQWNPKDSISAVQLTIQNNQLEDLQMTGKHLLISAAITTALLVSASAYAGGGMGGGMGGGQGMMGGQGHGMMGSGQNFSGPSWTSQPQRSPSNQYEQREMVRLREEIREKRQELSELYRSDKPDKALIDQKIAQLNALETDYDRSISSAK
jgi:Spy/CpxP family protein refolding chaperone